MQSSPPKYILMIYLGVIAKEVFEAGLEPVECRVYQRCPPVGSLFFDIHFHGLDHVLDQGELPLPGCHVQGALFDIVFLVDVCLSLVQEILKQGLLPVLSTDMQDCVTCL